MRVYVASSWRNEYQPSVVHRLRKNGHDVYDFRHPRPGEDGFGWRQRTDEPLPWSVKTYLEVLSSPPAELGYRLDWNAMERSEACVVVMPCGRSAHLEAGYFVGAGKRCAILLPNGEKPVDEPELMYKMAGVITADLDDVVRFLR